MKTYRVKKIFRTIQGEGQRAGTAAVFVRLVGCNLWSGDEYTRLQDAEGHNVSCPMWCDTDFTKAGSRAMTAQEIIDEAQRVSECAKYMVFTGGEPLLQVGAPLVADVQAAGFAVGIETNGTQSVQELIDASMHELWPAINAQRLWIVCSPKVKRPTIEVIDELKMVVPDYHPLTFKHRLDEWLACVTNRGEDNSQCLFVQPEDGPRQAEAVVACVAWVHDSPWWRVSVQTHKLLEIE